MPYKLYCTRCSTSMALTNAKVRELSFRFIECPKCKNLHFKIEIIKGFGASIARKEHYQLKEKTRELYEKYDKATREALAKW